MSELGDARLIKMPLFVDPKGDGLLVPTETGRQIPFLQIKRMSAIVMPIGAKRGRHAHKLCSQFMLCVGGAIDVVCDDGKNRKSFSLDQPELALFVPPRLLLEFDAREILITCGGQLVGQLAPTRNRLGLGKFFFEHLAGPRTFRRSSVALLTSAKSCRPKSQHHPA